ncbi:MAG: HPF/RaiA family ribosome-associated protein [Nitrospirae bacterium]|nr:HPF/RaiA family ribosome-associated protein [Candidatus Manganitrophaceae bacterium]
MDIKIEWQHSKPSPYWNEVIQDQFNRLKQGRQKITHARITLRKSQHHLNGSEEATVVLAVPGKTLTANKTGETIGDAINEVFSAIGQELQRYRGKKEQIGQKLPAESHPHGVIARLFKESNYGFIQSDGHEDIYFHRNSVHGMAFDELEEGRRVEFEVEEGEEGLQASRVTIK